MNTENLSIAKKTVVGVQFLFVAFGATVLVPLLIGINPATQGGPHQTRNVIIMSVMLTMGLGGAGLSAGKFSITGIGLAAVIGVVLNLILPRTKNVEKEELNG